MNDICEQCGALVEVSNCRFEGCRACWDAYMNELLEVERNGV